MKIFICGQRSFGKAVLKRLYEDGHEIVGIAPPPQERLKDKMVGYALLKGIPVISDCEKLISDNIPDGTELVISAHSHWIVSDKILDKCKYGGIGFHPSLLPRHRGQDAVRWAVHMKDAVTGATIYNLRSNTVDWEKQDERFATWEPSWDRPRLKRNELVMLGGGAATRTANPCKGCERECKWCTYYIADPEVYGRQ